MRVFQQAAPVIGNALALNIGNAYDAPMSAVQRAIKHFGSQAALADALKIPQSTVSEWLRGDRPVPSARRAQMERASKGVVRCEEFGSDMVWARIQDKGWPHPKGRPVLDVTKAAA